MKCCLLGALLLAVTVAVPANEALLDQARAFIEQGRYDAALGRVERYLSASPQDQRARFLRGVLLVETERSDEAIEQFTALVRDHPELPEPYNNLAVLYAARGQYTEARNALQSAINTHPSYAIAHENLGDIYAKLAGIAYDKALSLDGSNVAARGKLALVHELFSSAKAPAATTASTEVATLPAIATDASPSAGAPTISAVVTTPALPVVAAAAETRPLTTSQADAREAVTATVSAWARAWSSQDVASYLRQYGRGFQVPGGIARATWEAERDRRLRAPASIQIHIDDLRVEVLGIDRARATFTQRYRSDTYADRVRKVLGLAREDGNWRIVSEVSN